MQDESTPKNSTTKTVRTKEKSSTKRKVSEETNEEMPNGEIGHERNTERRKYLPNHAIKMNKKIQEAANIIEGKNTNGQSHRLYSQDMLRIPRLKDIGHTTPQCDINKWYKHTNVQRMWQTYNLE